jgi:tRNA (cmo5U34)-methyltransferase
MKRDARDYYADLMREYSAKIRQLVPRYDEMVQCIVELLLLSAPRTVLDVGAGICNVSGVVLRSIPETRVTAVEASDEMCAEARRLHDPCDERLEIVHQDILDFAPAGRFDAIFSNLVLHNIAFEEKSRLLEKLLDWLEPGGCFIWGDMIRHPDDSVQRHYVEYRVAFAREAGCSEDLLERNFEKEESDDYPLTIEQALVEAKEAGFSEALPVWAHDMFAVILLRKR